MSAGTETCLQADGRMFASRYTYSFAYETRHDLRLGMPPQKGILQGFYVYGCLRDINVPAAGSPPITSAPNCLVKPFCHRWV
jgi:hypothetical protein